MTLSFYVRDWKLLTKRVNIVMDEEVTKAPGHPAAIPAGFEYLS